MKIRQKDAIYLGIILLISLFISKLFLFQGDVIFENDVDFHYARAISTVRALNDGQIIPQLDPFSNSAFGYSWNIFYGPLPTYLIAVIYLMTDNIALSINSTMVIAVILIGGMMYQYMKFRTASAESALISSVVLLTSTTLLNNLYQYTGYGPLFATFFAVLALYGIQIILDKDEKTKGIIYTAIGGAGMVLSHTLTCLIILFFILLVLAFNIKGTIKNIWQLIISAFLSFGLSAFFLLPLLEAKSFQTYNLFNPTFTGAYMWKNPAVINIGRTSFVDIFLASPGVISFPSCLFWLSLLVCLALFFVKTESNSRRNDSFLFFGLAFISMISGSFLIDWYKMPSFLCTIQSPLRIMTYSSGLLFAISLGLAFSLIFKDLSHSWMKYSIVGMLLFSGILLANESINSPHNAFQNGIIQLEDIPEHTSIAMLGQGGGYLKNAVGEFFPSAIGTENKSLEVIVKEENQIPFYFIENYIFPSLESRKEEGILFLDSTEKVEEEAVTAKDYESKVLINIESSHNQRRLELPRVAYPGYKAFLTDESNEKIRLDVNASNRGYLEIVIPEGFSGKVILYYGMSRATMLGLILSVATFIIIFILTLKGRKVKRIEVKEK